MSIESSHGETEQSRIREIRLIDVIAALEKRGKSDEADYYRFIYAPFLSFIYDVDEDSLLYMTITELSQLSQAPIKSLKYKDWDNFYFGRAAFGNNG